jgi:hypothetical protein
VESIIETRGTRQQKSVKEECEERSNKSDPDDWDLATREADIAGVYWWRKIRS